MWGFISKSLKHKHVEMILDQRQVQVGSAYLRATYPLHQAWKLMITSVIFMSRSSSRWARTPALKNTLLWPMRYRFWSSSRALILGDDDSSGSILNIAAKDEAAAHDSYHENAGLFAIHEPLGNGIRSQDFIPAKKRYIEQTHLSFLQSFSTPACTGPQL